MCICVIHSLFMYTPIGPRGATTIQPDHRSRLQNRNKRNIHEEGLATSGGFRNKYPLGHSWITGQSQDECTPTIHMCLWNINMYAQAYIEK